MPPYIPLLPYHFCPIQASPGRCHVAVVLQVSRPHGAPHKDIRFSSGARPSVMAAVRCAHTHGNRRYVASLRSHQRRTLSGCIALATVCSIQLPLTVLQNPSKNARAACLAARAVRSQLPSSHPAILTTPKHVCHPIRLYGGQTRPLRDRSRGARSGEPMRPSRSASPASPHDAASSPN